MFYRTSMNGYFGYNIIIILFKYSLRGFNYVNINRTNAFIDRITELLLNVQRHNNSDDVPYVGTKL